MKRKKTEWVNVGLPKEVVDIMDRVIEAKKYGFTSRNDFTAEAVKFRLKEMGYYK